MNDLYHGKTFEEIAACKIAMSWRAIAKELGVHEKSLREWYNRRANPEFANKPVAKGVIIPPDNTRRKLQGKRFVFTSAQNNTLLHEEFFSSLLTFCNHNEARLFVSTFTYNKSAFQNGTKDSDDLWYDKRITEFMLNESVQVADGLVFCGELDILPTAEHPLSGFESYTKEASAILPHAKVAMQSQPRMKGDDPRFLYTTGAVTQRNYIQRKAGQKASFHHVFGAIYVEVDDNGTWFARQLIADSSGVFYDLDTRYSPSGTETGNFVEAINYGDIHIEKADHEVSNATFFNQDSLLRTLKPTYQVIHDLTDFEARNHHIMGDPVKFAQLHYKKQVNVHESLRLSAQFLQALADTSQVLVVSSNHHDAFMKWLKEADIKKDPENAETYYSSNYKLYQSLRTTGVIPNIYALYLQGFFYLTGVTFLEDDESFVICSDEDGKGGIELGMHGHLGVNGRRGSPDQFRALGRKANTGHTHSAQIIDGIYTAGVSGKLDMGYNKGPSSWSHSHILTYKNGKRTIVTIKQGKWRA